MRIDGVLPGQNLNLSGISNAIAGLNPGDAVKAQILEITSGELLLKLFDGTTFTASTEVQLDAKPGDTVEFRVKDKVDNKVFLETVKPDILQKPADNQAEIKRQLTALNIKPDSTNVNIATEIKANELPFTKENFESILNVVAKFKDLTPAEAVFLSSHKINIEEKSISTLKQLVEGKAQLGNGLQELSRMLDGIQDADVIDRIEDELKAFENISTKDTVNVKTEPELSEITDKAGSTAIKNIPAGLELTKADNIEEEVINILKTKLQAPETPGVKAVPAHTGIAAEVESIFNAVKTDNPSGQLNTEKILTDVMKKLSGLPQDKQTEIGAALKDLFVKSGTDRNSGLNTNGLQANTAPEINAAVQKDRNILHKTVESIFVKLDPENAKEGLDIKNLYRETLGKLEAIRHGVELSNLHLKNEILGKLDNIENNLKFINDINNYSTYVQIPINNFNSNTTGELYVLKNSTRKRKIDPDNVTMFISLDTDNLGRVESLINVNKKRISLNMRVEDKKTIDLIKENSKDLYNSLSKKGYKLVDLKYRLIEGGINLLNVRETLKNEFKNGNRSIDCRI